MIGIMYICICTNKSKKKKTNIDLHTQAHVGIVLKQLIQSIDYRLHNSKSLH